VQRHVLPSPGNLSSLNRFYSILGFEAPIELKLSVKGYGAFVLFQFWIGVPKVVFCSERFEFPTRLILTVRWSDTMQSDRVQCKNECNAMQIDIYCNAK
jgi:hypothetical protein